jgi:hypothetical protein
VRGDVETAARNVGSLAISQSALKSWSSEQARLISKLQLSGEHRALSAEIVLELGGDIANLPIIRRGNTWYTKGDLRKLLKNATEITVFVGDIDHDDEEDGVPSSSFDKADGGGRDALTLRQNWRRYWTLSGRIGTRKTNLEWSAR